MVAALACLVVACAPALDTTGTYTLRERWGYEWSLHVTQIGDTAIISTSYRGVDRVTIGSVSSNELVAKFDADETIRLSFGDGRVSGTAFDEPQDGWSDDRAPPVAKPKAEPDDDEMSS